jgi:hypothetical protein
MYLLPKTVVADLDKQRTFFWEIICKSKSRGGLGVKDIRNICLLSKWWWRLDNEADIWQVKAKYLRKICGRECIS